MKFLIQIKKLFMVLLVLARGRTGMGNDGGSIPKRGDMVKTKAKFESVDKENLNQEKWTLCSLSMEPLTAPIVACRLGKLYNKESVLNFLLERDRFSEVADAFNHINGLRDVKELKLKKDTTSGKFVCPLTGKEMNGGVRFVYYKSCGCVMTELALKELQNEGACAVCSAKVTIGDKIPLNGTVEEVEELRSRLGVKKIRKLKRKQVDETEEEVLAGPRKMIPISRLPGEILALKRSKHINDLYK